MAGEGQRGGRARAAACRCPARGGLGLAAAAASAAAAAQPRCCLLQVGAQLARLPLCVVSGLFPGFLELLHARLRRQGAAMQGAGSARPNPVRSAAAAGCRAGPCAGTVRPGPAAQLPGRECEPYGGWVSGCVHAACCVGPGMRGAAGGARRSPGNHHPQEGGGGGSTPHLQLLVLFPRPLQLLLQQLAVHLELLVACLQLLHLRCAKGAWVVGAGAWGVRGTGGGEGGRRARAAHRLCMRRREHAGGGAVRVLVQTLGPRMPGCPPSPKSCRLQSDCDGDSGSPRDAPWRPAPTPGPGAWRACGAPTRGLRCACGPGAPPL
jgi:hypothetical protein